MITKVTIKSFKSLESVTVDLGQVNVFIGANGSGKSNLLEAIGVLSAAADGKVNDQMLLQRGVRPGVPMLYKSAFPALPDANGTHKQWHIFFGAESEDATYEVSLHNPLKEPSLAWRFKHELWQAGDRRLATRSPATRDSPNTEQGLAALEAVKCQPDDPALLFLKALQGYVIFTPTTSVLRGISQETQPRKPLGLSGGLLPEASHELQQTSKTNAHARKICHDLFELTDWAHGFGTFDAGLMPLSPSAAATPRVITFVDRYMQKGRNRLSGYDAPEGALFVLFLAVLAAHDLSPLFFAVDNADHGLNPGLVKKLMSCLCGWFLDAPTPRQILLTTHNPLVLDGLRLQDDRVRLFAVDRTLTGRTAVRRINIDAKMLAKAREGWTLSRLWVMGYLGGMPNV